MKNLINAICEMEGKKHQASVGDVREILKILVDLLDQEDIAFEFLGYVESRAKKKIDKKTKGVIDMKKTAVKKTTKKATKPAKKKMKK